MIRKAKLSEIADILEITKACAADMVKRGIFQWNEHYPSKKAFENDVQREELYVLERNGQIIGAMVISTAMDEEYIPVEWRTENRNNLYIHRLCIHPNFQGKGYAQQLMDYAESFAIAQGSISIRLDTFSQNKRNQKFYEARGYERLGNIFFPMQSKHPFHCYELVF